MMCGGNFRVKLCGKPQFPHGIIFIAGIAIDIGKSSVPHGTIATLVEQRVEDCLSLLGMFCLEKGRPQPVRSSWVGFEAHRARE